MSNYFIPGLTEEDRVKLESVNISALPFSIDQENGLLVNEADWDQVQSVLDIVPEDEPEDTGYQDIQLCRCERRAATVEEIPPDARSDVAARPGQDEEGREDAFQAYFAAVLRGLNTQQSESYTKKQKLAAEASEYLSRYADAIRQLKPLQLQLANIDEAIQREKIRVREEFERICRLPKVKKLEAKGGKLLVFTHLLCCKSRRTGKLHEIGEFRIELSLEKSQILWFNLTRRVKGHAEGMQHPHIFIDGTACYGSTDVRFAQFWANWEIALLVLEAIKFVETATEDDPAGGYLNRWPLAKQDENQKQ